MSDKPSPEPQQPDHAAALAVASGEQQRWERRYNAVAVLRIAVFAALCVAAFALIAAAGWQAMLATAVCLAVFMGLALWHVGIDDQRRRARVMARYHQRGLGRLAGDWNHGQDDGRQRVSGDHAYAHDLDLVGPQGLYQLLNTAGSEAGRRQLAAWLFAGEGAWDAERSAAARALAGAHAWRAELATAATEESDLGGEDPLAAWLADRPPPPGRGERILVWLGRLLVPAVIAWAWVVAGASGGFWALVVCALLLSPVESKARVRSSAIDPVRTRLRVRAHARALAVVADAPSETAPVAALAERARGGIGGMRELAAVCGGLSGGANAVRAALGALVLLEWWHLRRLHAWADRHGTEYANWGRTVAEAEGLACLATYAAEQGGAWPTEAGSAVIVDAEDLAHPLLPRASRVGNDLRLDDGQVLLLTGANASGKSTFMRAVALACVLASLGVTVPARRCAIRPLRVATVMRVHDDLLAGRSRFQAEVDRLKRVLDLAAESDRPVLLAFDEILAGTNSAERSLGTQAILDALRGRPGATLVSTHDLELARLAEREPARFVLAHFADRAEVEGADADVVFDYVLRPGVLQTTNALRVMRAAGLPVEGVMTARADSSDRAEPRDG